MKLPPITVIAPLAQATWIKKGESRNGDQYIMFLLVSGKNAVRCECFDDPENHETFKKCTEIVKGRYYSAQGILVNSTGKTKEGETFVTNFLKVKYIQEVEFPDLKKPDFNYDIFGFGM